jgi:uncharacterized protein
LRPAVTGPSILLARPDRLIRAGERVYSAAMANFTPWLSLLGGAMIGAAAMALWLLFGRIAGISGIAARLLPPVDDGFAAPRLAFLAGISAAPVLAFAALEWLPKATIGASPAVLAIGGLLVGFGAVVGNGCTSGHGVCGLSRLSVRSLAATATFMACAALSVFAVRHL